MGIHIGILVSTLVAPELWQAVYAEAFHLAGKLNLAASTQKEIHGHKVYCLAPTEETVWNGREGWWADADYEFGDPAESFFFPKALSPPVTETRVDILARRAHDIDLIELDSSSDEENIQRIWGGKTQEHPYHYALLAIGCLVQDRLGDNAMVFGDINAGQCREAVRRANKYLAAPISVPCQCEPGPWFERIARLGVRGTDRIRIAMEMYLGRRDAAFSEGLRMSFPTELLSQYWWETFDAFPMNAVGFREALSLYLTLGFPIPELCRLISFPPVGREGQYYDFHERFIRMVMDTGLHLEEKDSSDVLVHDPEDPELYGVGVQLIRGLGLGFRNKKINRYIPLEALRKQLRDAVGAVCDTDSIIDDYLRKEQAAPLRDPEGHDWESPSEQVNHTMHALTAELEKKADAYEIFVEALLPFYRPGERIEPQVQKNLVQLLAFARSLLEKNGSWAEAAALPIKKRQALFARKSQYLPFLRDQDWEKILTNLEKNPDSFSRYYPLFHIRQEDPRIRDSVRALMINDDLYTYALSLLPDANQENTQAY